MAVRSSGQLGLVEAFSPHLLQGSGRLDRLSGLVKWYRFERLLAPLRGSGPGRPAYAPLVMFKVVLLQSLYGLSDAETEEAMADRQPAPDPIRGFVALRDCRWRIGCPITARSAAFAIC